MIVDELGQLVSDMGKSVGRAYDSVLHLVEDSGKEVERAGDLVLSNIYDAGETAQTIGGPIVRGIQTAGHTLVDSCNSCGSAVLNAAITAEKGCRNAFKYSTDRLGDGLSIIGGGVKDLARGVHRSCNKVFSVPYNAMLAGEKWIKDTGLFAQMEAKNAREALY